MYNLVGISGEVFEVATLFDPFWGNVAIANPYKSRL